MSEKSFNISKKHINDYLHYGYIPELALHRNFYEKLGFKEHIEENKNSSQSILVEEGIDILNSIFDYLVTDAKFEKHLVPLSGGLDSRLILAALLDRIPKNDLQTITFGSPGSFDYEIPKKLSSKLNLNSKVINCLDLDFSIDNLINACLNGGRWTSTPDIYINQLSLSSSDNINRWTGFFGGEIAGYYSSKNVNGDEQNYLKFSEYQKRSQNFTLTPRHYSAVNSLLRIPFIPQGLTQFEGIYIFNRSAAGAIPILYPDGQEIISPFIHPRWINFISKAPKSLREKGKLYENILLKMYPELMKFPTKNYSGLGLGKHSPFQKSVNLIKLKIKYEMTKITSNVNSPPVGVNYLYYKEAFKTLPTLRKSIEISCNFLEKENVIDWFSPIELLNSHLTNKADYSHALLLLLGLYVNIQAEQVKPYISQNIEL